MIVNKSMFPLQTGFSVISEMQGRFAKLQMQLGTGMKASTLAEMGRDLPLSLSVRSRLEKIEGFSANIDTVNLRLSFLDKTMTRFDAIEGEARTSAVQGQYGTNNINMATLPSLSKARLDELVTLLNSDVAGRYLFGGSNTDSAPVPDTTALLEGLGGKAGFKAVVGERKAADAGDGRGRLLTGIVPQPDPALDTEVTLTEDGIHPFGLKLSVISTTAPSTAVAVGGVGPSPAGVPQRGDTASITFSTDPDQQIVPGQSITLGFTLPDGGETQVTMTAISEGTPLPGQFLVGTDPEVNAANFQTALDDRLRRLVNAELAAASTYEAAENFFNGPGEPVLRVDGDPATATALKVGTAADTVLWYQGQSPAVSASGMGRLSIGVDNATVTLSEAAPTSASHGFQISGFASASTAFTIPPAGVDPSNTSLEVIGTPVAGDTVSLTLTEPSGKTREVTLTAVTGKAGAGQFTIGPTDSPLSANEIASNFSKALTLSITGAAAAAEGNPRQSVTAQVDDSTRVSYGIEANESGLLRLMRTMASMSVETYPTEENIRAYHEPERLAAMALPEGAGRTAALEAYQVELAKDMNVAKARFDAMAIRQQGELSEAHNSEHGSIEILTMELGVARGTLNNSAKRHTDYKAQLDNLLSDVETVSKEEVAMEILALQTRLQASYQVTSMVSQLSLVNFL
jgi:flagellar hook-associated protein 3 FlgL